MKQLVITWQRLVSADGRTCDRCGATYEGVQRAVNTLQEVLHRLDIEPVLETREIDDATFRAEPSLSTASGCTAEWLNANVGSRPCCSVCGDTECRTVKLGGATFETIPERLLVRAALIAAAELLE